MEISKNDIEGGGMTFLQLTLEDGRAVLVRADLIEQVRQRESGAEIWLSTAVVIVGESIEQVRQIVNAGGADPGRGGNGD